MTVDFTDKEVGLLITILENYLPELRAEIASGVRHEWKIELHKEEDILDGVLGKLKALEMKKAA